MFLFWPGTSKGSSKGRYSSVLFEFRDIKRYMMCIVFFHARTLWIFMRGYFLSPWASTCYGKMIALPSPCFKGGIFKWQEFAKVICGLLFDLRVSRLLSGIRRTPHLFWKPKIREIFHVVSGQAKYFSEVYWLAPPNIPGLKGGWFQKLNHQ